LKNRVSLLRVILARRLAARRQKRLTSVAPCNIPKYQMTKRGITLMQCRRPSVGFEEAWLTKRGFENFEHLALDLNYGKTFLTDPQFVIKG
jgi:hypothetical protein